MIITVLTFVARITPYICDFYIYLLHTIYYDTNYVHKSSVAIEYN